MSTLTRTNSLSKKPQYKDYVSFLGSYRNGKKDDQASIVASDSGVNFSINSSANNSSSSVFSDVSDNSSQVGAAPAKPKQVVKSEMFIQINSPPAEQTYPTQVFKVALVDKAQEPEQKVSVGQTAKIFEKNDQIDLANGKIPSSSLKAKQSSFRQNSIEQLSKKFEKSDDKAGKRYVKRATSIGRVSNIFENENTCQERNRTLHKPKNFNAVPKPFQADSTPSKANNEAKTSMKPAISPKPIFAPPAYPKFVPEPPRSYTDSIDSALSSLSISPSPSQCASPPPGGLQLPPPPPPLPPSDFSFKPVSVQKAVSNNTTTLIKPVTVPQSNGQANTNGTLDKNDPRVKKAVYGALRNMYGAYHDQANDYLATLPKNRVRKNNGLDSIIDSIASQGGLEKLSGRSNPKQDI